MKGLSGPDADALQKLAQVLDVEVSQLLGTEIIEESSRNEIAEQLARINEQLVVKNRLASLIWEVVGCILVVSIVLFLIVIIIVPVARTLYISNVLQKI